jgi:hypothetical protein
VSAQFKVAGHETWYEVVEVTAQQAHNVGCPGATHRIEGPRTGQIYFGTFTFPTDSKTFPGGRPVKIPGTNVRVGRRAVFHAQFDDNRETLAGHLTTD